MSDNHQAVTLELGRPERDGRRLCIIKRDGQEVHRDKIDPHDWRHRKGYCERFGDLDPGSAEYTDGGEDGKILDLGWLDQHIIKTAVDTERSDEPIIYPQLSCAQLADAQYSIEYLIDGALVAGQPCVIAGPKKALKTSFIVDMAMSLATGTPFLGRLPVSRAARVAVMSGESGMATIQETALRVAVAKGIDLRDIGGLVWSDALPQFGSLPHMDALERFLRDNEAEVLFIDPAYLAMPGTDAGNLFIQGDMLRTMNKLCQKCGAMLVLVHHTKRSVADPFKPCELDDIAWAGFPEWARQWCLVSRREQYEPGTGEHRLWLNLGGSAGHSALWAVDVFEGAYDGGRTPRRWEVSIMRAEEARNQVSERREAGKQAKQDEKVVADRKRLVYAAAKFPGGETLNVIKQRAGISGTRAQVALHAALDAGELIGCEVTKKDRKKPHDGYRLADGGQA